MAFRATSRKKIINSLLAQNEPRNYALFDEIVLKALTVEKENSDDQISAITRSNRVSFARTIRSHMDDFQIHKVGKPDQVPVGILIRSALCRIENSVARAELSNSDTFVGIGIYRSTRYQSNWIRIQCSFRSNENSANVVFPVTSEISIVGPKGESPSVDTLIKLSMIDIRIWRFVDRIDSSGFKINAFQTIYGSTFGSIEQIAGEIPG